MSAATDDTTPDHPVDRHTRAHGRATPRAPIGGNDVTLLPSGGDALDAMLALIDGAEHVLELEYYEFEDVHWRGRRIVDALIEKLRQGVRVIISYDAVGSAGVDDSLFDSLRRAGAKLLEFHPFNPFKRRFNPFRLNDRDHRKILLADGRVAILGGVNLSRVYENPASAGAPGDPKKAFWFDAAVRIEGPVVAEIQLLFLANWHFQGGRKLSQAGMFPPLAPCGTQLVTVDGSAPRQHRQLYFESLKTALTAARSHVLLATGYFVPTFGQWRLLTDAAERGVQVDLLLAGYSDVPSCVHAARALYGRLLERGVRIHEMNAGVVHAKVATIDGVWTAIGSSNLDRRSFLLNNEIDAIVLGRETAEPVEAMLRGWIAQADTVTLEAWQHRSNAERLGELLTRFWRGYM